jgi:hypothetical protein
LFLTTWLILLNAGRGSTRLFAPALVPPGIDHQEYENHETEEQKNYCPGLVVPELLEALGNFVEIHAEASLHHPRQKQSRIATVGMGQ